MEITLEAIISFVGLFVGGGGGGGYNGVIAANGGNGGAGTVILSFTAADLAIDPVPSQVLAAGGACPEPVVRLAGDSMVLTKDVHYEVTYMDNDALGTALMTVTGIGTYAGKVGYASFTIATRYFLKPAVAAEAMPMVMEGPRVMATGVSS